MQPNVRTRPTLLAGVVLALVLVLTACGGGGAVSQADVDAIRGQLEAIERRLDDVDAMLATAMNGDATDAEALVDEAHQEIVDTRALLANVLAELPAPPADPVPGDPLEPAPGATPDAPAF